VIRSMKRRGPARARTVFAVCVVAVAAFGPVAARAATVAQGEAEAFGIRVSPEEGRYPIPISFGLARGTVGTPPVESHGIAASFDSGILGYSGPGTVETDYPVQNLPREASGTYSGGPYDVGPLRFVDGKFESRSSGTPSSVNHVVMGGIEADGVSIGQVDLVAEEKITGVRTSGSAASVLTAVEAGPLRISAIVVRASAFSDGTEKGARAEGGTDVLGATVAGVPVIVSADGVRVSDSEIEGAAVVALQEQVDGALASAGITVRLVHPDLSRTAGVSQATGGGLWLRYGTSTVAMDGGAGIGLGGASVTATSNGQQESHRALVNVPRLPVRTFPVSRVLSVGAPPRATTDAPRLPEAVSPRVVEEIVERVHHRTEYPTGRWIGIAMLLLAGFACRLGRNTRPMRPVRTAWREVSRHVLQG